jgi:hypothetical protein
VKFTFTFSCNYGLERNYISGSEEITKPVWGVKRITHTNAMQRSRMHSALLSPSVVAILAAGYKLFTGGVNFSFLEKTKHQTYLDYSSYYTTWREKQQHIKEIFVISLSDHCPEAHIKAIIPPKKSYRDSTA